MRTIATANQKGGVGKTTLTYYLATHLAGIGKKVLCVDIDPQRNLTANFVDQLPEESNVWRLFEEKNVTPCQVGEGLYLVGSDRHLSRYEADTKYDNFMLLTALAKQEQRAGWFDYMLIDTPPNLALFTTNAFLAADDILVPMDASKYATMGLAELFKSISKIHEKRDSELPRVLGIVLMDVQERLLLTQTVRKEIDDTYEGMLFATSIPTSVRVKEAVYAKEPVMEGKARDAFASLFVEIDKRLA